MLILFLKMLEKPLILIGYGLGGLIIKRVCHYPSSTSTLLTSSKALSILSDPALQLHGKDVLNLITGVVFFGTPHMKTKQPEQWFRLTLLLSLAGKLPKRFIAQSETDANAAAIICEDFEQSGLEAVVLSVYETKPTKVKSARRMLKNSVTVSLTGAPSHTCIANDVSQLVDKFLAETWAKKEKLLGNDVSHERVNIFYAGSPIQQEIGLLLMSALSTRRHNMTASAIQGKAASCKVARPLFGFINKAME